MTRCPIAGSTGYSAVLLLDVPAQDIRVARQIDGFFVTVVKLPSTSNRF
ncbi:hypothetical protein ACQP25_41155 [Microtetraspora malaysiensis]